ncbi:MAG: zinc-ribbon domain-containing protein [Solirubrobacterales bacterium]|nr:zinc-ribbon domain-containing protein [Solirubrobacterales bacterium]
MFFFLFGWGDRLEPLGAAELRTCPRCHNTTTWQRLRRTHRVTLFFVPLLRWGRRELEACPVCGEAVELPHERGHASRPRPAAV